VADQARPFVEHLEELRQRLIKSILAVVLASSGCYYLSDPVIRFLARTAGEFVFLRPTEAIFTRIKIALALGVIAALPVVLYQAWRFVSDALVPGSRRSLFWAIPVSYVLFIGGCCFGFFFLVPVGAKYLLGMGNESLKPLMSVEYYVEFTGAMCLALGLIFQMPIAAFFLSKFGVMEPAWLAGNRRIAIIVTYIVCALATPGPDPVTALMLFAPAYLLFELSILAARLAAPRHNPAAAD
jgi:sec-independent protein translocase protein TatC